MVVLELSEGFCRMVQTVYAGVGIHASQLSVDGVSICLGTRPSGLWRIPSGKIISAASSRLVFQSRESFKLRDMKR